MSEPKNPAPDSAQLQRRNEELLILNVIAEALNKSIHLDQALEVALNNVAALLGLHTGWVWLLNQDTGESFLAASQDLPPGLKSNPEQMEGSCYCLDTYRKGDMAGAANINVVSCSRLSSLVDGTDGLRYHASIPLYAKEKKLGVLNVASPDWRELSSDDLQLLHTVGDLLSIAVERAWLFSKSKQFGAVQERNRLAREIHDTLAQGLAGVALQLESADAILESGGDQEEARAAVQQALLLARSNLDEARRSVMDLRAAPLEERTLVEAISDLIAEQSAIGEFTAKFEKTGTNRPIPVRLEAGLYRITQEAFSNIVQHALASEVLVKLRISPVDVGLLIKDNGRGFDPNKVQGNRFGLVGLNERVKLLGGTLNLTSGPDVGTILEVEIPFGT